MATALTIWADRDLAVTLEQFVIYREDHRHVVDHIAFRIRVYDIRDYRPGFTQFPAWALNASEVEERKRAKELGIEVDVPQLIWPESTVESRETFREIIGAAYETRRWNKEEGMFCYTFSSLFRGRGILGNKLEAVVSKVEKVGLDHPVERLVCELPSHGNVCEWPTASSKVGESVRAYLPAWVSELCDSIFRPLMAVEMSTSEFYERDFLTKKFAGDLDE